MGTTLITKAQASFYRDFKGVALIDADLVPEDYKRNLIIPYWVQEIFPQHKMPLVMKGSRDRMWSGYISPHRAAVINIVDRAIRRAKLTKLSSDWKRNCTKQAQKRYEDFYKFVLTVIHRASRHYPRQRVDVDMWAGPMKSFILGKEVYIPEEEAIRIIGILELASATNKKLKELQKLTRSNHAHISKTLPPLVLGQHRSQGRGRAFP